MVVPLAKQELRPKVTTVSWTPPGGGDFSSGGINNNSNNSSNNNVPSSLMRRQGPTVNAHTLFTRRAQRAVEIGEAARLEAMTQAGVFNSTGGRPPSSPSQRRPMSARMGRGEDFDQVVRGPGSRGGRPRSVGAQASRERRMAAERRSREAAHRQHVQPHCPEKEITRALERYEARARVLRERTERSAPPGSLQAEGSRFESGVASPASPTPRGTGRLPSAGRQFGSGGESHDHGGMIAHRHHHRHVGFDPEAADAEADVAADDGEDDDADGADFDDQIEAAVSSHARRGLSSTSGRRPNRGTGILEGEELARHHQGGWDVDGDNDDSNNINSINGNSYANDDDYDNIAWEPESMGSVDDHHHPLRRGNNNAHPLRSASAGGSRQPTGRSVPPARPTSAHPHQQHTRPVSASLSGTWHGTRPTSARPPSSKTTGAKGQKKGGGGGKGKRDSARGASAGRPKSSSGAGGSSSWHHRNDRPGSAAAGRGAGGSKGLQRPQTARARNQPVSAGGYVFGAARSEVHAANLGASGARGFRARPLSASSRPRSAPTPDAAAAAVAHALNPGPPGTVGGPYQIRSVNISHAPSTGPPPPPADPTNEEFGGEFPETDDGQPRHQHHQAQDQAQDQSQPRSQSQSQHQHQRYPRHVVDVPAGEWSRRHMPGSRPSAVLSAPHGHHHRGGGFTVPHGAEGYSQGTGDDHDDLASLAIEAGPAGATLGSPATASMTAREALAITQQRLDVLRGGPRVATHSDGDWDDDGVHHHGDGGGGGGDFNATPTEHEIDRRGAMSTMNSTIAGATGHAGVLGADADIDPEDRHRVHFAVRDIDASALEGAEWSRSVDSQRGATRLTKRVPMGPKGELVYASVDDNDLDGNDGTGSTQGNSKGGAGGDDAQGGVETPAKSLSESRLDDLLNKSASDLLREKLVQESSTSNLNHDVDPNMAMLQSTGDVVVVANPTASPGGKVEEAPLPHSPPPLAHRTEPSLRDGGGSAPGYGKHGYSRSGRTHQQGQVVRGVSFAGTGDAASPTQPSTAVDDGGEEDGKGVNEDAVVDRPPRRRRPASARPSSAGPLAATAFRGLSQPNFMLRRNWLEEFVAQKETENRALRLRKQEHPTQGSGSPSSTTPRYRRKAKSRVDSWAADATVRKRNQNSNKALSFATAGWDREKAAGGLDASSSPRGTKMRPQSAAPSYKASSTTATFTAPAPSATPTPAEAAEAAMADAAPTTDANDASIIDDTTNTRPDHTDPPPDPKDPTPAPHTHSQRQTRTPRWSPASPGHTRTPNGLVTEQNLTVVHDPELEWVPPAALPMGAPVHAPGTRRPRYTPKTEADRRKGEEGTRPLSDGVARLADFMGRVATMAGDGGGGGPRSTRGGTRPRSATGRRVVKEVFIGEEMDRFDVHAAVITRNSWNPIRS